MFSPSPEGMSKAYWSFEVAHCLLTSVGEEVMEGEEREGPRSGNQWKGNKWDGRGMEGERNGGREAKVVLKKKINTLCCTLSQ